MRRNDASATTLLVDYLRDTSHLTGTKWMCREGGRMTAEATIEHKYFQLSSWLMFIFSYFC